MPLPAPAAAVTARPLTTPRRVIARCIHRTIAHLPLGHDDMLRELDDTSMTSPDEAAPPSPGKWGRKARRWAACLSQAEEASLAGAIMASAARSSPGCWQAKPWEPSELMQSDGSSM